MAVEQVDERGVDAGCGGEHLARIGGPAGEVARDRARLAGDQVAGGRVPAVEVLLEVDVEPAGGDEAQVDRRRPDATDVADAGRSSRPAARPGRGARSGW